ncbi:hypothetical protein SLS62_000458 [Diatrype stigma]|uniref:Uncharacterized protein n=1 Tax=Diatrype stigma TaxID=117547 RepID=A0AAN9YSJ4_9PEZI
MWAMSKRGKDYDATRRNGKVPFRNQFVDDFEWRGGQDTSASWQSGPGFKPASFSAMRVCTSRKMLPEAVLEGRTPDPDPRGPIPRVSPPSPPPPPLQFQSWLHDEILAEFLNHCLPLGATQEVPLSWLRSLMPMKKEIDALPLAMSALAIGWAGHTNGEPQLIDKGLQLYNAAVRQLRGDIQGRSPLQVLATTVIFTIYELFEFGSEQSHGWLCHVSGIAATLRMLGPSRVANEPYLQIFNFVRMIYTIQGLRRRQAACAAAPMWRIIPYAQSAKNQFHKFLDLALLTTELLEEADSVQEPASPTNTTPDRPRAVLCKLIEHIQNMKNWQEQAHISLVHGPTEIGGGIVITSPHPSDRPILRGYPSKIPDDLPVTFDGVQNVRLMHLYWGVLLTLYMTILGNTILRSELEALQQTLGLGNSKHGNPSQLMTVNMMREEANELADNIAMYGDFCCQNLWQSFGPMVSIFTLEVAVRWYQNHGIPLNSNETDSPRMGVYSSHCQALLDSIRMQSEERQMFDDYQHATFGDIDILRLPWCDRIFGTAGPL